MNCKAFRSVFNVFFIQQRSVSSTKYPVKIWSEKETELLLDLVKIHGTDWVTIQTHFKDRGRKSIASRYRLLVQKEVNDIKRSIEPKSLIPRGRKWTSKEDSLLLELVKENGLEWSKFVTHFKHRKEAALAQRYDILIEQSENRKGGWTKEEAIQFESLFVIYGEDFNLISKILKTRSAEQCRIRYKYLSSLPSNISKLTTEQIQELKKAVEIYGTNDFKLILQKAKLPYNFQVEDIRNYYFRELDPKIVIGEWTKEEVEFMVQIFNELDGCMELVQSRLPIKRGLKDMWIHYRNYNNQ